jgi:hypothetical protein
MQVIQRWPLAEGMYLGFLKKLLMYQTSVKKQSRHQWPVKKCCCCFLLFLLSGTRAQIQGFAHARQVLYH